MEYDTPPARLPDEVRVALESFFFGLGLRRRPIPIGAGIREVRAAVPKCDLTDEALGTVVAQYAIERGYTVNFENGEISVQDRSLN